MTAFNGFTHFSLIMNSAHLWATKITLKGNIHLKQFERNWTIFSASVSQKDKEIFDLKAKIAEVLAVMPGSIGVRSSAVNSAIGSGRASSGVFVPSTLSLDHLPASTDLSFTGKISSLGLSDLEDKLMTSGIYSAAAQLASSSAYTKTNWNMNGDN